MTTMKMGMIIAKGTELEMREEFDVLKKKAREGFKEELEVIDGTFIIRKEDIKITFSLSKSLGDKFAVYQIIE